MKMDPRRLDSTDLIVMDLQSLCVSARVLVIMHHAPSTKMSVVLLLGVFMVVQSSILEDPKYVSFHTESYVHVYRPFGIFPISFLSIKITRSHRFAPTEDFTPSV